MAEGKGVCRRDGDGMERGSQEEEEEERRETRKGESGGGWKDLGEGRGGGVGEEINGRGPG